MIAVREQDSSTVEGALQVQLDRQLPATLPVGRAGAVFCFGACWHPRLRVVDLAIVVDGERRRPAAQRMPRLDQFSAGRPYRSGFWATVPIPAREGPGELRLRVEARLEDGTTASAPLATIDLVATPSPPSYERVVSRHGQPVIAICMATHNSDLQLFRTQIESIRAQTDRDWVCVISDDCSEPDRFRELAAVVEEDPRFLLSRSERHLSFYRNFERALGMIPPGAELVALSDHDDRWYPDKLASLRAAIGSAGLVYSDLRRVDAAGNVRGETLWEGRSENHTNLASLLVSNTIPGASCMFRRHVLDHALPFPTGPGWDFHDHWIALVALALGDIAYVDRPLYDYVQHPGAILGRTASGGAPPRVGLRGMLNRWRSVYFSLYLQRQFHAQVLLARCDSMLSRRKRRALCLMVAADRSLLALAWLTVRLARPLFGHTETLQVEGVLVRGILWRHVVTLRTVGLDRPSRFRDDASFPPFAPDNLGRRQRRWLARQ
jgi:glycosyltransferase involved in cell wall biosynthesis